jgi:hypothetical protein
VLSLSVITLLTTDTDTGVTCAVVCVCRGCGMYGGNVHLKFCLQWTACALAGTAMAYYPYRNAQAHDIPRFVADVKQAGGLRVDQLWRALKAYCEHPECAPTRGIPTVDVFAFVIDQLKKEAASGSTVTAPAAAPAAKK